MKIGGIVVRSHSDGIMSQISFLGPRYIFTKCRKTICKK